MQLGPFGSKETETPTPDDSTPRPTATATITPRPRGVLPDECEDGFVSAANAPVLTCPGDPRVTGCDTVARLALYSPICVLGPTAEDDQWITVQIFNDPGLDYFLHTNFVRMGPPVTYTPLPSATPTITPTPLVSTPIPTSATTAP